MTDQFQTSEKHPLRGWVWLLPKKGIFGLGNTFWFWLVTAIRSASSGLDLLGVLLLGLLIQTMTTIGPAELEWDSIAELSVGTVNIEVSIAALGFSTLIIFVLKTFLSLTTLRSVRRLTTIYDAALGRKLVDYALHQGPMSAGRLGAGDPSKLSQAAESTSLLAKGSVMGFSVAISEGVLILALGFVVIITNPILAAWMIIALGAGAIVLQKSIGNRIRKEAAKKRDGQYWIKRALLGVHENIHQLSLHGYLNLWRIKIQANFLQTAGSSSSLTYLMYLPRYAVELSVLVLVFGILGLSVGSDGASFSDVGIILFAAFRMAGAILPFQGAVFSITEAREYGKYVISIADQEVRPGQRFEDSEFIRHLIGWTYENKRFLKVTGPSGVGKSTTVLGALYSDEVQHVIGDKIACAPQGVSLFNFDLATNISLNPDKTEWVPSVAQQNLIEALSMEPILASLQQLGSGRSTQISGGELQRLNLLRAHQFENATIFLDEPTEGLDEQLVEKLSLFLREQTNANRYIIVSHDSRFLDSLGKDSSSYQIPSGPS